jgi:hypothetical protein
MQRHALLLFFILFPTLVFALNPVNSMSRKPAPQTIDTVLQSTGIEAEKRLQERFKKTGAHYPPDQITLLAMKDINRLELW